MRVTFAPCTLPALAEGRAELLLMGAYEDVRPFPGLLGLLDYRLSGFVSRMAMEGFLTGRASEVFLCPARSKLPYDKAVTLGLGPRASYSETTFLRFLSLAADVIRHLRVRTVFAELPSGPLSPSRTFDLYAEFLEGAPSLTPWCLTDTPERIQSFEDRLHDSRRRKPRRHSDDA